MLVSFVCLRFNWLFQISILLFFFSLFSSILHCVVFVTYSFYFTFHQTLLMGSCMLSQSLIIIIIIIINVVE
jgi:hypothetical protein